MFCFLFPLFGSLLPEPLRVLRCREGRRRSHSRCFFRRITLARKEEFAGNALQNGGNRHGSLHSHRQNLRRWRHGRREKKGSETVERDDGVAGIETVWMESIKVTTAGRDKQRSAGQTQRGLFPPCESRRHDGRRKAECVTVSP